MIDTPKKKNQIALCAAGFMLLASLMMVGIILSQGRSTSSRYTQPGIADYRNGNYPRAIQELSTAIKLEPSESYAHYYLGLSLKKTGDMTGARRALVDAKSSDASSRQPSDAFRDRCDRAINDIDSGH